MAFRIAIPDFQLANPLYSAATVTFYTIDEDGEKTTTRATLYREPTGSKLLTNPQIFDSDGKLKQPVYIAEPVIAEIVSSNVASHTTGAIAVRGTWRDNWVTGTQYRTTDMLCDGATLDLYIVNDDYISGASVAADVSAGHLTLVFRFSGPDLAPGRIYANILGIAAPPQAVTISDLLDVTIGNTRGTILTRGASGWIALPPGTSGHFLKSNGAGADPAYEHLTGGGDLLSTNNGSDFASRKTTYDNLSVAGANVASAATIDLDAATGNLIGVTGTTTITAITLALGRERTVRFASSGLVLTHVPSTLELPGGANITTSAGDYAILRGYSGGLVRCVAYTRANGKPIVPSSAHEISDSSVFRGYIDGLIIANGTDATNDLNFGTGVCRDASNSAFIVASAPIAGKRLDENWAPGANVGMRYSGAAITNGTYHLWAGRKLDGTQDYYAHPSAVAATVLANWQAEPGGSAFVYVQLIGSVVRLGDTILPFFQIGDDFRLKSPVLSIDGVSQTTTSALRALTVPTGIKVLARANVRFSQGSTGASVYISSPDANDENPGTTAAPLSAWGFSLAGVTSGSIASSYEEYTDTSGQWRFDATATVTLYVAPTGWRHPRGKNA